MQRTILITGGAQRLGSTVARHFAQKGWHVIIHYNTSHSAATKLCEDISANEGSASLFQLDLEDIDSLRAKIRELAAQHPGWCTLVNNASLFEFDSFDTMELSTWQRAMTVNAFAPTILAREFVAQTPSTHDRAVINVLDQKLANMNPDFVSYTISKGALKTAADMMALAFAKDKVRICNVAPGLMLPSSDQTKAEFTASATLNLLERQTHPHELADAVHYLATARFATGQTLFVDSGQHLCRQHRDVMFHVRDVKDTPPDP